MRFSFIAPLGLAIVLLSGSPPALAAKCVLMIVKDPNGVVVQVGGKPIVGIMVGKDPLTGLNIPPTYEKRVGAETVCPPERLAELEKLFEESCLTEDRRKQAASKSQAPIETINLRCGDMAEALRPPAR
jgi:hypothetical protein